MQKHIASHHLATMEQQADRQGSATVLVKPRGDESCRLEVSLTGPATYRYEFSFWGLLFGTGVRFHTTERVDRHIALESLIAS